MNLSNVTKLHSNFHFVGIDIILFAFNFNEEKIGISRSRFTEALNAEGIPCFGGYVKPLYLNPLYTEKRAFAFRHYTGKAKYEKGICPNAETLYEKELVGLVVARPPSTIDDMDDIITAIKKIIENKQELIMK